MGKKFYNVKEFADLIGYSERQVRQFCIDGKIKAQKVDSGCKWIVPANELDQLTEYDNRQKGQVQMPMIDRQIIKDKRKHFKEIRQLVRQWKEQLYDEAWGTLISYVDLDEYEPSPECVWHWGRLFTWRRLEDHSLEVWFPCERQPLFEALKVHLADEELWRWWEEVKQALSQGLEQELKKKHLPVKQIIVPRTASDLVPKIVKQLEKWSLKGVFPGKCPICPG